MFEILKQTFLWLYFLLVRTSKRKSLINKLIINCKKRNYIDDIPDIPTVLDEIKEVPKDWEDLISFVGFDNNGRCLGFHIRRNDAGKEVVQLDLNIPGHGIFSYKEYLMNKRNLTEVDNICSSTKLKLYCLQPMKRWRIYFSGTMELINDEGNSRHVTVSIYWACLSDPFDHFVSSSCWTLAKSLTGISWKDVLTTSLNEGQVCYEQLGEIRVRVEIENHESLAFRLRSVKERMFKLKHSKVFERHANQYLVLEKSGLFLSNQLLLKDEALLFLGYIVFPFGDSSATETKGQKSTLQDFPKMVTACSNVYNIKQNVQRLCFRSDIWKYEYSTFTVNDRVAFGLQRALDGEINAETFDIFESEDLSHSDDNLKTNEDIMIVAFDQSSCKVRSLVGGKGSQLAIVAELGNCNVPYGICVTANAYRKHVNDNPSLENAVKQISRYLTVARTDSLKQTCESAVRLFQQTLLENDLEVTMRNLLEKLFGNEGVEEKRFAVRSSSLGEDGIQASSAGQLDTFLCVQGFCNVIEAVRKCWASSVSYQVVEYRRQNGQNLTEDMGVVIQEMLDAEVAGVLFTKDPVSGDENKIIINAALGLGESVVSGEVTPDTIFVKRKKAYVFEVEKMIVGEKEFRIVADEGAGTKHVLNSKSEKSTLSLQHDEIMRLCETAVEIEAKLGTPQDIEWATQGGKVYILQTRPITTLDTETEEELVHEFDTPLMSDKELITPCNAQEALPGACTTLSADVAISATDRSIKSNMYSRLGLHPPIHIPKFILSCAGMALFNATSFVASGMNILAGENVKTISEINILGMPVNDHTVESIREYYGRNTTLTKRLKNVVSDHFVVGREGNLLYERLKQEVEIYKIGEDATAAETLYEAIDKNLNFYYEMWRATTCMTVINGRWPVLMISILKGSNKDMSAENYADLALLLSECKDVYSANVPVAINNLAKQIALSDFRDKFLDLPLDKCDSFLRSSNVTEIKSEYTQFMHRHGHRCIRECDFIEKSWSQEPENLMKMLKTIIKQSSFQENPKALKTIDEIVDSLQTPLSPLKRLLMKKFFVRKAMKGVCERERAKSYAVKACSIFKDAYWRLASMMVQEGRLPDENLLFFLTHREIGTLVEHRSIKLVRLAKRRRKLLPLMNETKYNKINFGVPQPVRFDAQESIPTWFTLNGMPMSRGKVTGRACVIKCLEDADQICEGDLLICRCTDVGWSPYFPLINGLVTEMGGVISHGAVVAREYGIPCVVNVTDATKMFKTGDNLILDATAGTVSKI